MVHRLIDGAYRQINLRNEPPEYLAQREQLRLAEIDLMRQRERVAEMRRRLPLGTAVEDYVFEEGPRKLEDGDAPVRTVRLAELFSGPQRAVFIYHMMFGKLQSKPCPMCTAFVDGLNGVAHHLAQNIDVAIVAAADPTPLRDHARNRGWDRLRFLSCGTNTFKYDFGSEDREGNQDSTLSVFARGSEGMMHHFYTAHPRMAGDIKERGLDLLSPIWNALDYTPGGRGDFYAKLDYPQGV